MSTADRPNSIVLKTRQAPGESFSQVPAPARLAAAAGERRRRLGTTWWRWGSEPTAARPHFSTCRYKRSSRRLSAELTGRCAAHFSMFWNTRQLVVAPPSELRTMAGSRFGGRGGGFWMRLWVKRVVVPFLHCCHRENCCSYFTTDALSFLSLSLSQVWSLVAFVVAGWDFIFYFYYMIFHRFIFIFLESHHTTL